MNTTKLLGQLKLLPRFIFAILFTPIRWLTNRFTRPAKSLLELHFSFCAFSVNIQTIPPVDTLNGDLLIASYIMFLARYFCICEERQEKMVREFLLGSMRKSPEPTLIAPQLYRIVLQSLSPVEQDAAANLFKIHSRIMSGPPLVYSEAKEPDNPYAKYSFYVFQDRNTLKSIFHMSSGPDIILLPLSLAILYNYVSDKLLIKGKTTLLNKSIIGLLEAHESINCRSWEGLAMLPIEIIKDVLLPKPIPSPASNAE